MDFFNGFRNRQQQINNQNYYSNVNPNMNMNMANNMQSFNQNPYMNYPMPYGMNRNQMPRNNEMFNGFMQNNNRNNFQNPFNNMQYNGRPQNYQQNMLNDPRQNYQQNMFNDPRQNYQQNMFNNNNNVPQNNQRPANNRMSNNAPAPSLNSIARPNPQGMNQNQTMSNLPKVQDIPPEVSFEPLTPEMLKMVGGNTIDQSIPAASPNASPPPAKSPPNFNTDEIMVKTDYLNQLESFIQGERNSSIYYKNLSDITERDDYKNIFLQMSRENEKLSDRYNQIYKKYKGELYEIKNNPIMTHHGFRESVQNAILEESKTLKELSTVYEQTEHEKDRRYLNSVLYKKIGDIGSMNVILFATEGNYL